MQGRVSSCSSFLQEGTAAPPHLLQAAHPPNPHQPLVIVARRDVLGSAIRVHISSIPHQQGRAIVALAQP